MKRTTAKLDYSRSQSVVSPINSQPEPTTSTSAESESASHNEPNWNQREFHEPPKPIDLPGKWLAFEQVFTIKGPHTELELVLELVLELELTLPLYVLCAGKSLRQLQLRVRSG